VPSGWLAPIITAIKNIDEKNNAEKAIFAEAAIMIPRLLYPFAPHVCEEMWQMLGNKNLIHEAGIPQHNPNFLVKDEVTYVVQIMGKLRGSFEIGLNASQEEIKEMALSLENVKKHLEGKKIVKIIVVPKKLVSIVAK